MAGREGEGAAAGREGEGAAIYLLESDRQRPFPPPEERQGDGVFRAAQPELASLHQWLDAYYGKVFTGRWKLHAFNGAFSILAGIISLLLPVFLDSGFLAFAGIILTARGALTLIAALSAPLPGGFAIGGLPGTLHLLAGLCLLLNVFVDPAGLVLFFAAYFVLTGFAAILLAVFCRRRYSGQWEWAAVSGVLNFDLALICLSRLPEPFIWTLAIFLGLDLIAHGSALLAVTLAANDNADRRAGA
jgi:uncharacterized membrane protein HdeD (DUF308 family)